MSQGTKVSLVRLSVAVSGPNLAANRGFAEKVKDKLERIADLRDVQFGQSLDYPTVDVAVDRERAGIIGADMTRVSRALAGVFFGICILGASAPAGHAAGAMAIGTCAAYGYAFDYRNADAARVANVSAYAVSADGSHVAYVVQTKADESIHVRDVASGKDELVAHGVAHLVSPALSPDGSLSRHAAISLRSMPTISRARSKRVG